MFALTFSFPAGRYHATPWGRNVNEADVAWPPEPWRILRALIAVWWRKGDRRRWADADLARLVDRLAESLPHYRLPEGAIHAHTRHYMPREKGSTTLVFDAFVRLARKDSQLVVAWPDLNLAPDLAELAADLADSLGYLGRAESWVECSVSGDWCGGTNCCPYGNGEDSLSATSADWERLRVLAPLSASEYEVERRRLLNDAERQVRDAAAGRLTDKALHSRLDKRLRSKGSGAHTLPERLVDALSLDTADHQQCGWSRPPASREVLYVRSPEASFGVVARRTARRSRRSSGRQLPTVARFLLAGRPRPRIEDAVRIGELMRLAALARFGWERDEVTARRMPLAPWEVSGRGGDGKPLKEPGHGHAFWLPEDADEDGWIDHVSVYIAGGMSDGIRDALDHITRLWLAPRGRAVEKRVDVGGVKKWRLALEGFGTPADFSGAARVFSTSSRWRSVTPFLAAGHLKASGYQGEVRRLLGLRGLQDAQVGVTLCGGIMVGGVERRTVHFRRSRSRGRERQPDPAGAFLDLVFPEPLQGPVALGYGSHFGLGLFSARLET